MRRPLPPIPVLAAGGELVVWTWEGSAGLIEVGSGAVHVFDEEVGLAAASSRGSHVALGTGEGVVVHSRDHGWGPTAKYRLEQPAYRLAVDESGLVVVATVDEDEETALVSRLHADERHEVAVDGVPFTLLADVPRRRVLVAGQKGRGAYHGAGDRFVGLYEWDEFGGEWDLTWSGPSPVPAPNGWAMPLTFGDIGVHDLERLAVISPDTNPDDVGRIVQEYELGNLETVVASPDGGHVAWFWGAESGPAGHVCALRLADGTVMPYPEAVELAGFPGVAVDDEGGVTLADTIRPHTVRVRCLVDGTVDEERFDVGTVG